MTRDAHIATRARPRLALVGVERNRYVVDTRECISCQVLREGVLYARSERHWRAGHQVHGIGYARGAGVNDADQRKLPGVHAAKAGDSFDNGDFRRRNGVEIWYGTSAK